MEFTSSCHLKLNEKYEKNFINSILMKFPSTFQAEVIIGVVESLLPHAKIYAKHLDECEIVPETEHIQTCC